MVHSRSSMPASSGTTISCSAMRCMTAFRLSPTKARWPSSISNRMTPAEKTSEHSLTARRRMYSGAM
jgi:hypothetical protein